MTPGRVVRVGEVVADLEWLVLRVAACNGLHPATIHESTARQILARIIRCILIFNIIVKRLNHPKLRPLRSSIQRMV